MEVSIANDKVYKEILLLKKLVLAMKEDLEDRFLTAEEELSLEESLREFKEGKTISLEQLEKGLCMN
jgi:hypothetical protein